jgi:hypothetical protein
MVVLCAWSTRDLGPRERQWVLGLLTVAVALRLLALALFFLVLRPADGSFAVLFPDEGYIALRARLLKYEALGIPLGETEYREMVNPFGESALHDLIAYMYLQLGDSPYGIRLLSTALYLTGMVAIYRAVRVTFGRLTALGGLAIALFLPSMFAWSISSLKEPVYHFLTAIALAAALALSRATSPARRLLTAAYTVGAVVAMAPFRSGGSLMVGGGIAVGWAMAFGVRKRGAGICGILVCLAAIAFTLQSPSARAGVAAGFMRAATQQTGYVHTDGKNYRTLDPEFYARDPIGLLQRPDPSLMTLDAGARYVVRAIVSFIAMPLPWTAASAAILAYIPEQVVWYVLVALAVVGVWSGFRVDVYATCVLAGTAAVSTGVIALASGNIGTLVRHRSLVLVALQWLSAAGATAVLHWITGRRSAHAAQIGVIHS